MKYDQIVHAKKLIKIYLKKKIIYIYSKSKLKDNKIIKFLISKNNQIIKLFKILYYNY